MEKCPLCSDFFHKNQIVNHIINCEHWNSGESTKDLVCTLCKHSVFNIRLHFLLCHSRPHKCRICNDRFVKMINLKRHMKIHLRTFKTKYKSEKTLENTLKELQN